MASINPGPAQTQTANTEAVLANNRTTVSSAAWASNTLRLLAVAKAIPITATGDIAVVPIINSTSFIVSAVYFTNPVGGSAAALTVSLNGGPGVTGTSVVASAALTGLTASTKFVSSTVAPTAAGNSMQTATMGTSGGASNYLYLNATVASGAATAMDMFVVGYDISPTLP
jgi:hypothetical protein